MVDPACSLPCLICRTVRHGTGQGLQEVSTGGSLPRPKSTCDYIYYPLEVVHVQAAASSISPCHGGRQRRQACTQRPTRWHGNSSIVRSGHRKELSAVRAPHTRSGLARMNAVCAGTAPSTRLQEAIKGPNESRSATNDVVNHAGAKSSTTRLVAGERGSP